MKRSSIKRLLPLQLIQLFVLAMLNGALQAQPQPDWDVTQPRGQTRSIAFDTEEGTWMSLAVSPDGEWIAFDLLGHIYRLPISGGTAECLTQDSGMAVNYHPAFSPDGSQLAFVSDRSGQSNVWIMNADGSDPKIVVQDGNNRFTDPVWTHDGQYLIVARNTAEGPRNNGLWLHHIEGGAGVELIGNDVPGADWPAISPDGRFLYFHERTSAGGLAPRDAVGGSHQIRRYEFENQQITAITEGNAEQQYRGSSGGAYAPEVSPDGRWLAFARRIPGGTLEYKGHRFGPRTALWLRDLKNGRERVIMDPIEIDMAEGIKIARILPDYTWMPDGNGLIIPQGGKIRRLYVESGRVETIPFQARVERTISALADGSFRIPDQPFRSRFIRWPTSNPEGDSLVFQAVGRLWIQQLPGGQPRRLTSASFQPLEYAPAWSPNGEWVAFTSWDESEGGHLWKIRASGGEPVRLTEVAGEYLQPVWTPEGARIVMTRGSGASFRGRTWASNPWYELVSVATTGGPVKPITLVSPSIDSRRQIPAASIGPGGRIFFPDRRRAAEGGQERTEFVSVVPDGTDRRVHLTFPFADEISISPDGRRVAFQEGDNVYVMPISPSGKSPMEVKKRSSSLPITPLSTTGGLFPRWRGNQTVEFGSANRYLRHDLETGMTGSFEVNLQIQPDRASGRVAFSGARLLTMDSEGVIEHGTIVADNGRISCVGTCSTAGAQVYDARGKTILPGYVDMHAHHYREHQGIVPPHSSEQVVYLAYGVTTTMSPATWSQNVFPTAELIEAGIVLGPRAFSTGDPVYAGDGTGKNIINQLQDAEDNAERLASWGAVFLKLGQPRRQQRQWIVEAARKRGLRITAEGSDLNYNLGMLMDGNTAFEHAMGYLPLYRDVNRFYGQAGAFYSPTLLVGGPASWNEGFFWQDSEIWKDPKQRRFHPWRQLFPHTRRRMLRPRSDYSFPWLAQQLADIIADGGGGDIGSHGQQHGLGTHWDLWAVAEGMPAAQALEVATLHGARFLGAEQDLGSLAVGKLADFQVLEANPLEDIRNSLTIRYVVKSGRVYDADTLDEIWPRKRPFGPYYWINEDALRDDSRSLRHWDRQGRK